MWILLGIPVGVLIVILIYPLCYSLYISFFHYNFLDSAEPVFAGLANYADVLTRSEFWQSMGVTTVFVVLSVGLQMVIGFLLALLLYKDFRGANLLRPAFLLPYVIPATVVGIMWKWMLNSDYGILRLVCEWFNIESFSILGDSKFAIYGLILADVWHMTPLVFILLVGGLQSIPDSILEAATIDGSNGRQKFFYVILPMMRKVVMVTMIYRILGAVKTFDKVLAMTQGGPGKSTQLVSWLIYSEGFKSYDFGSAAAMSYIVLVVIIVFCVMYMKFQAEDKE